jgi:probable rRNA maturation factor
MNEGSVPKRGPVSEAAGRVLVSNRQDLAVDEAGLASLAERTLAGERRAGGEVSLSFVTPEEMAELHVRYSGEAGATDVLSFPLDEDGLLGDVVVCPSEAARNNPVDPSAELRLLVVHGVLHLLGYDHEDESERRAMWDRQEAHTGMRP